MCLANIVLIATGDVYPRSGFVIQIKCTQNVLFLWTEPIGSASPKFTSDTKSATYERMSGSSVALTCPAQGFPLPAFRLD